MVSGYIRFGQLLFLIFALLAIYAILKAAGIL